MNESTEKIFKLILICFFVIFSIGIIGEAAASDYYIATNGSDQNDCSIKLPCATIAYASTKIVAGDTLYLRGGTYSVGSSIGWTKSGSAESPITVKAYTGEIPIVSGKQTGYYIWSGAHHITIDGLEFTGFGGAGVAIVEAGHDITIKNCYFHDITAQATAAISIRGISYNITVENSTFERIGRVAATTGDDHSIYIEQASHDITVSNNYFKNTYGGAAIQVRNGNNYNIDIYNNIAYLTQGTFRYFFWTGDNTKNINIFNNTVYTECTGATVCKFIDTYYAGSPSTIKIKNNISYITNGSEQYRLKGGEVLDYNLYYPSKPSEDTGSMSIAGDPLFVKAGSGNFRLSSGSPAIDKGSALSIVPNDYEGNKRPGGSKYDIGAYENIGTILPPNPPLLVE